MPPAPVNVDAEDAAAAEDALEERLAAPDPLALECVPFFELPDDVCIPDDDVSETRSELSQFCCVRHCYVSGRDCRPWD